MSANPTHSERSARHITAAVRRVGDLQRAMQTAERRDPSLEDDHDWRQAVRDATDLSNRLLDVAERRLG